MGQKLIGIGYFGFGNYGDELIAETLKELGISPIKITSHVLKFLSSLKNSGKIFVLSGGLFHSFTNSNIYYSLLSLLLSFKNKVVGFGISIEKNAVGLLSKVALSRFSLLGLRDTFSLLIAKKANSSSFLSSDLVFLKEKFDKEIVPTHNKNIPTLILHNSKQLSLLGNIVEKFNIYSAFPKDEFDYKSPREINWIIENSPLIITSRLHVAIVSLLFKKPFVFVAPQPHSKHIFFFQDNNLEFTLFTNSNKGEFNLNEVVNKFNSLNIDKIIGKNKKLAHSFLKKLKDAYWEDQKC